MKKIFNLFTDNFFSKELLKIPKNSFLFEFKKEEDIKRWTVISDQQFGGKSNANFELNGNGKFYGNLDLELPSNQKVKESNLKESGFAAIHTKHFCVFDEAINTIQIKAKTNSKIFCFNIQRFDVRKGDLYQTFLETPINEWKEIKVIIF
jgi:hypothetical protein